MEKQKKLFMCYWDDKIYENGKTELKKMEFFTEENGYLPENISEIARLEIGKSFTPEEGHIVTRVQ